MKHEAFEDRLVRVTYPDGKNEHETTIPELRKRWSQETKEWQFQFFNDLELNEVAYSRVGKYELI